MKAIFRRAFAPPLIPVDPLPHAFSSGTHQVGGNDEFRIYLALGIQFETDCSPTNEALEQQEGNSRHTGDKFRRFFELVTASGWFYLHGPILKQSA